MDEADRILAESRVSFVVVQGSELAQRRCWHSDAIKAMSMDNEVFDLSTDVTDRIRAAQRRQFR